MTKAITVNERGAMTLPKEIRERLGVSRGGQLIVEVSSCGEVTLRAGVVVPVEIYSDQRVAEFERMNEAPLAGRKLRWGKGR